MNKLTGRLIIAAGITVAAFPWLKAAWYEYNKQELLKQWAVLTESALYLDDTAEPAKISIQPGTQMTVLPANPETAAVDAPADETLSPLKGVVGIISIEKLGFVSPIFNRVTDKNLNLGICVVDGSPKMGGEGNYCLAGHRSRVSGRHFNRLNELAAGDTVTLENEQSAYTFAVTDVFLVTAGDNWVMAGTPYKTELTLITCDYSTEETGRLIVRCELIKATILNAGNIFERRADSANALTQNRRWRSEYVSELQCNMEGENVFTCLPPYPA